jgi:hypothetical protein
VLGQKHRHVDVGKGSRSAAGDRPEEVAHQDILAGLERPAEPFFQPLHVGVVHATVAAPAARAGSTRYRREAPLMAGTGR